MFSSIDGLEAMEIVSTPSWLTDSEMRWSTDLSLFQTGVYEPSAYLQGKETQTIHLFPEAQMASVGLISSSFSIAMKMEGREIGKRNNNFWVLKLGVVPNEEIMTSGF